MFLWPDAMVVDGLEIFRRVCVCARARAHVVLRVRACVRACVRTRRYTLFRAFVTSRHAFLWGVKTRQCAEQASHALQPLFIALFCIATMLCPHGSRLGMADCMHSGPVPVRGPLEATLSLSLDFSALALFGFSLRTCGAGRA
jgi:hypothetical protein